MILFLDFDGCLHHFDVVVERTPDGKSFPAMRGPGKLFEWAPLLEHAIAGIPDIQIVISSGWVWWFGLDFCRAALPPSLSTKVVSATWQGSENMPLGWVHLPRVEQVKLHARRHGIAHWVALDDDVTGLSDDDRQNFVVCDPEKGMSDQNAALELAIKLTHSPRDLQSQRASVRLK